MRLSPADLARSVENLFYFRPVMSRDKFLASYPRSGNTWLRAIAFHLKIGREPASMAELDNAIPDEHIAIRKNRLIAQSDYIVKTHSAARINQRYRRVLYIIRDPRDVLPSYYRYVNKAHNQEISFEFFCEAALRGAHWPCSWAEHVTSWETYRDLISRDVFFVNYDSLRKAEAKTVAELALFFELDVEEVTATLSLYDFQKMKQLEAVGRRDGQSGDKSNWFVGSGSAAEENHQTVERMIKEKAPDYIPIMQRHGFLI